jgi:hypothetical protein
VVSTDKKAYVVLLEDEMRVGEVLRDLIESMKSNPGSCPENLELVHLRTSKEFADWLSSAAHRDQVSFFVIDKNIDIDSPEGKLVRTENGLVAFEAARNDHGGYLKQVDYAIFSSDPSLTPFIIADQLDDDADRVKLIPKLIFKESPDRAHRQLLSVMLSSPLFIERVKTIAASND